MNFWHMQLHPHNMDNFPPARVVQILERTSVIGLGDWPGGEALRNTFENQMQIGDVVAIRSGQTPIALVEVTGNAFFQDAVDENLDWFQNRREVKLLDLYRPDYNFFITQSRGTLTICANLTNPTSTTIINWHNMYLHDQLEHIAQELLEFKKQIILQGPPGTGKTRMAEIIAKKMTESKKLGSPTEKINTFFKTFEVTAEIRTKRLEYDNLLSEFQDLFPKGKLKDMPLEDYALGLPDSQGFCYWLEYKLKELGLYSGFSTKYLIYWSKDNDQYKKSGAIKDISDDNDAFTWMANKIHDIANKDLKSDTLQHLGKGLILKISHSYNPDDFFPINSEDSLGNALRLMGVNPKGLSFYEKNKELQQLFQAKKKEFDADVTSVEFMRFLFGNFDMKGHLELQADQVYTKGEFKTIQFHPAYTYEDFVRGIIAKSTGTQVEYLTVNKVLAEFAETALGAPTSKFVLVIDEINRANLPAVLGELIYALEYRGKPVETMYTIGNENQITLPKNLYIIGTMNTADRSVGHIDYAIRRRFAFVDVLPDREVIQNQKAKALFDTVTKLFIKTNENGKDEKTFLSADFEAKEVQLGHSYFLAKSDDELKLKLEYEIKPILYEYMKDGVLLSTVENEINGLQVG
jgi:5-methylcytosine-specific restriction protein B